MTHSRIDALSLPSTRAHYATAVRADTAQALKDAHTALDIFAQEDNPASRAALQESVTHLIYTKRVQKEIGA